MTAQEIEEQIIIEESPVDDRTNMGLLRASVTVEYFARFDACIFTESKDPAMLKLQMKKHLAEHLMRKIYDDQRELLYKAIYDVRAANPYDMTEQRKAMDALLLAALRQPHDEATSSKETPSP